MEENLEQKKEVNNQISEKAIKSSPEGGKETSSDKNINTNIYNYGAANLIPQLINFIKEKILKPMIEKIMGQIAFQN